LNAKEEVDATLPLMSSNAINNTTDHELLEHFTHTTTDWLGSSRFQKIFQEHVILNTFNASCTMDAVLAISVAHMDHQQRNNKYNFVARKHYGNALKSYTDQLGALITKENVDDIIGCALLHAILAFENISWLLSDGLSFDCTMVNQLPMSWIRSMQGMGILQRAEEFRPYFYKSIWIPVFLESGGCDETSCQHDMDLTKTELRRISRMIHALYEPTQIESSDIVEVYREPATFLCKLLHLDVSHENIGQFLVFIGRLSPEFLRYFEQMDVVATVIMAYWCALISSIKQWWITDSALLECRRLCAILARTSTPLIRELLLFPAQKCNYKF
jgi:hypothetical protein